MKIAVEIMWVGDGTLRNGIRFCKHFEVDRVVLGALAIPGFKETGLLDPATLKQHVAAIEAANMSTSTVVWRAPAEVVEGEPAKKEKLYGQVVKNLDAMADSGLSILSMFCGVSRPADVSKEPAQWDKLISFYGRLVEDAEQRGIKIASHFAGTGPARSMLNGAEAYRQLFKAVPSKNNGFCFCVGNAWVSEGERIYDVIDEFQDRIFYVHMRSTRLQWGEHPFWWDDKAGTDVTRIWKQLKDIGYEGDVRAEHLPGIDGVAHSDIGYAWSIGYMKALQQLVK